MTALLYSSNKLTCLKHNSFMRDTVVSMIPSTTKEGKMISVHASLAPLPKKYSNSCRSSNRPFSKMNLFTICTYSAPSMDIPISQSTIIWTSVNYPSALPCIHLFLRNEVCIGTKAELLRYLEGYIWCKQAYLTVCPSVQTDTIMASPCSPIRSIGCFITIMRHVGQWIFWV